MELVQLDSQGSAKDGFDFLELSFPEQREPGYTSSSQWHNHRGIDGSGMQVHALLTENSVGDTATAAL
jgi:hypothetical protein